MNPTKEKVMSGVEFTQGICQDGAAILADGNPITIEQVLD